MRGRLFIVSLLIATGSLRGDIVSIPISADLDAEFAHAADLLEAGDRAKAEQALGQIQTRSGQTAWKARVAMLLAFDDERRGNWGSAARLLSDAPAAAIGLEPYRRLHLARALSHLGQWEQAERELAQSFDSDEAFVSRPAAALELARLREKRGRRAEALAVLERAFATAAPDHAAAIGEERIRMSLAAGNPASVRAAAADLVAAGVDATSAQGRRAVADELARSTPAVRARFARARIAAGDARRGVVLLRAESPSRWPPDERAANLLALARGLARLRRGAEAEKVAARIPEDGTPASFEARLEQADLALARLRHKKAPLDPEDPRLLAARRVLAGLLSDSTPEPVRSAARDRLIRIAGERDEFDSGLAQARSLVREGSDASAGFEPLWKLAWKSYLGGDFETARSRLEQLTPLYPGISLERRLSYWTARCLEREGRATEAAAIFRDLAAANPADVYALFASAGCRRSRPVVPLPRPILRCRRRRSAGQTSSSACGSSPTRRLRRGCCPVRAAAICDWRKPSLLWDDFQRPRFRGQESFSRDGNGRRGAGARSLAAPLLSDRRRRLLGRPSGRVRPRARPLARPRAPGKHLRGGGALPRRGARVDPVDARDGSEPRSFRLETALPQGVSL